MRNLRVNKILWLIPLNLAFVAAIFGALNPSLYTNLIDPNFAPSGFAQDCLTIFVALGLNYLILTAKENQTRKHIFILSVIGSICYLYAIFSIEQVYNWLYFLYLAIFSSSFFSVVYSISSLNRAFNQKWTLPRPVLYVTAGFSILIALLFSFLWTSALIPLIQNGDRVEYLFSIYVIDLCFIMPAFVIVAISSLRNKSFGLLMTPAMFVLGIFVIFPLGLGELAKPLFNLPVDTASMAMSFVLSGSFLALSLWQLKALKLEEK